MFYVILFIINFTVTLAMLALFNPLFGLPSAAIVAVALAVAMLGDWQALRKDW